MLHYSPLPSSPSTYHALACHPTLPPTPHHTLQRPIPTSPPPPPHPAEPLQAACTAAPSGPPKNTPSSSLLQSILVRPPYQQLGDGYRAPTTPWLRHARSGSLCTVGALSLHQRALCCSARALRWHNTSSQPHTSTSRVQRPLPSPPNWLPSQLQQGLSQIRRT
jgi:hypothetical protein